MNNAQLTMTNAYWPMTNNLLNSITKLEGCDATEDEQRTERWQHNANRKNEIERLKEARQNLLFPFLLFFLLAQSKNN